MTCNFNLKAQENPPHPATVTAIQNLSFGAFFHGFSGGTVIIGPNGSRSATGDVILASLGYTFYEAIFEIEAEPGTVVSILNGPDATLTGSNGGTMIVHPGNSNPGSPFIVAGTAKQVHIGATLNVGNPGSNPVGNYSGFFSVTFIQE